MKIAKVETLHCDAGWRPWSYVKITTDDGVVGYGEYGDGRNPRGIIGCVNDLSNVLIGRDPRAVDTITTELMWIGRNNPGGVFQKAIGGIDAALWDIKGKALGVPVYELFGGPTRDTMRAYWSHCGTSRARHWKLLNAPPLKTYDDIARLAKEVVARGFTAFKTNIVIPGENAAVYGESFAGGPGGPDRNISRGVLEQAKRLIGTFRDAVGGDADILLDLNFNFKTDGIIKMAEALAPYELLWLEFDMYDPEAIAQIKLASPLPICTGECLYTTRGYRRYIELQCSDYMIIDVPWNGFTESKKIADYAATYDINIAPHNFYSHLSTYMSAALCASVHNVRIMEADIDDVPWKDDVVTDPPDIKNGYLTLSKKPGWGTDLNETEMAKHPWPK